MIKIMKKLISFALLIIPFILIVIYWSELPDNIPMHWNVDGEIDRYSDSKWGIIVLPVVSLVTFLMFFLVPKIDPKGNFSQFINTYWMIINILMLFFLLLFMLILYVSLGYQFNQSMFIHNALYVLFMLLGNYFGKIRANYFIGIRTPWTLENEEVWRKTHRMAGVLWVVSSLLMLTINFVYPDYSFRLLIPYLLLIVLIPTIYSYMVFRKLKLNETQN